MKKLRFVLWILTSLLAASAWGQDGLRLEIGFRY